MKKILLICLISIIAFTALHCGNSEKKEEKESKQEIGKMNNERYIDYIIEYKKIEMEMEKNKEKLKNNPKLIEKYNERIKQLEEKYPNAAQYPTTLSQEEQNKLGEKIDQALKKLESTNQ